MSIDGIAVRKRLNALHEEIVALSRSAAQDRKPIALDQQSVGRLSRLDSMQIQAMAHAAESRRALELRRVEAALQRLDGGEYGWCVACGEPIAPERLTADPAAAQCAQCAQ